MASNTAKITMTADDQGVLQVLQKQGRAMDSLATKLERIEKAGDRGSRKVQTGFTQAGAAIKGAAAQLVGFGSAAGALGLLVATVKKEMEDLRRRDSEARVAQRGVAESVRSARINFVPDQTVRDNQLEGALRGVAQRTRTPVGVVAEAFSSAASAKGSLSNQAAMSAVEAALTLKPGDLATGTELGSRSLDIAKLKPGISPRAAVGFMLNVQSAARVTALEKLGQTAPTAIAAATAAGDTPEQGAEMFATLTQLLSDAEGRKSATLQKQLIAMTSAFVPQSKGKDERGSFRIPKEAMQAFGAAQSPTARIGVLQQNPALLRDFMARGSFAAETRVAAERLLSGEAGAMAEMRQAQQVVNPLNAAQEAAFDAKRQQLEGGQFQPVLTAEQGTEQLRERARLANLPGARRAASRQALQSVMEATGDPWLVRKARMAAFEQSVATGNIPERAAVGIMQGKVRSIEGFIESGDAKSPEELRIARANLELLREQIRILGQLRDDTRRRDPPAQRRRPAAEALGRRD